MAKSTDNGIISLSTFLRDGGKLEREMEVFMETNTRSEMKEGIVISWSIGLSFAETLGRYGDSSVTLINIDNCKEEPWPITMLYIYKKS